MVRVGSGASEQAITAVIRALNASTTPGTNLAEAAFSARRAFPAPPEQLLRREAMPTRHLGHHGARDQRLFGMRALSSADHRRRPPAPLITSMRRGGRSGSSVSSNPDKKRSPIRDRQPPSLDL